jgi:acyl-coenzyme A synthetase/AMP-(fatty) acid ligase
MNQQQFAGGNERFVRRYDYGDGWTVAADLGVADEAVDVDVVGRTAIVVVDSGGRVSETEFGLPGDAERVDVKNGVLTIYG